MSSLPPPPVSGAPIQYCFHHHDRPTGRACTRCGRPACWQCLKDASVGSHCFECVKAAAPPRREQARRWNARQHFLVSSILIAVNVAVFVAMYARPSLRGVPGRIRTFDDYGLYGPAVADGEWYRIITSGFLHDGLFHILFNMAALAQFGRMLEGPLGRLRFALLYFVSLLAGAAGALIVDPQQLTVGASGAIFGLVGALAIALHRRGIGVWQSGIGGLLLINLLISVVVPNISLGGHVGGLIGGGLAGAALIHRGPDNRPWWAGIPVAIAVGVVAVLVAMAAANGA